MSIFLEYNLFSLFFVIWSDCEWMFLCNNRILGIFKYLIYYNLLLVGNEVGFLKKNIF